jgi:23S rRNA (adenine2503-C2)-methyltransferase
MVDFRNLTVEEMEKFLISINEKKFRARQIYRWIHKGVNSFDDMTDISIGLQNKLKKEGYIDNIKISAKYKSSIDGTVKYLMELRDGNLIECVVMSYSYGNSICISTQAGCSMGCAFCASTIGGRIRNLTSGEMLGEILEAGKDSGYSISNIVLMGTGEPLDNFDNVIKFLKIVNHPSGINIGMRHITISTCGIIPRMYEFADLDLQVTFAISLHAPDNEIRKEIMPVAKVYDYDELLDACRYYINKTNKRVTFEYALIDGINDSAECADELAHKIKNMLCHVNLIPVNNIESSKFKKPDRAKVLEFQSILIKYGIDTTIRRELGSDINAACGQLRRKFMSNGLKR